MGLLWQSHTTSYFVSLPITYTKYGNPLIDVKLGNNIQPCYVRIGSRFPMVLDKAILDKLDKQPSGITKSDDLNGEHYERPSYLVPKVEIGDLTIKNITVTQVEEGTANVLGQYLGGKYNLLLDFLNSRIIACDSFSRLKSKGVVNEGWIKVPFKTSRAGVILHIHSDLGVNDFALCTVSENTQIRRSLIPTDLPFTSTTFCIGKQDFGSIVFEPQNIPAMLSDIDGFIGMDFLKNHAIYLDYSNKIAYIEPPRTYFERLPITLSSSDIPIINIYLEGNLYPVDLDLGMHSLFALSEEVLHNIYKTSHGTAKWNDYKENHYQSPSYIIPEVKLGNLTLFNVITRQSQEEFHVSATLHGAPKYPIGVIGRPILEKYNLFLDFKNSAIYACDSLIHLQQEGLLSESILTIPFTLHHDGILLLIETDMGNLRLLLDTGSTCTVVRAPCSTSVSKFCLLEQDFGPRSLTPFELHPSWDCDGFLGMDFLLEHSIYIDYPNRLLFLDLQKTTPKSNFSQ